jgi:hypothetical protein
MNLKLYVSAAFDELAFIVKKMHIVLDNVWDRNSHQNKPDFVL